MVDNDGSDVGLTKTLVHELTHELLHQRYLASKDSNLSQFFLGKEQGRAAMEQQAEISAWMFMHAFGYDLKTTSLNYTLIWGGNKENMVKVFDTVSSVVNHLIDHVNTFLKSQAGSQQSQGGVSENQGQPQLHFGQHISPMDVANMLGVGNEFKSVMNHQQVAESFYRFVGKKIL